MITSTRSTITDSQRGRNLLRLLIVADIARSHRAAFSARSVLETVRVRSGEPWHLRTLTRDLLLLDTFGLIERLPRGRGQPQRYRWAIKGDLVETLIPSREERPL